MTLNGLRRHDQFDYRQVLDFIYQHGAALPHVVDQPYRLTSYSLEAPGNYAGWVDAHGQLRAFGIMQEPFAELDYAVHPDLSGTGLPAEVLRWAARRGQGLANAAHLPFTFYVWETPSTAATLRQLQPLLAPSDRTMVTAQLDLTPARAQSPRLPEGFALRTLDREEDSAAYVALQQLAFGTRKMTLDWRRRMCLTPEYLPGLNVAAVDPAGELAAASIGWVGPDGRVGQLEPGITHPRYRRIGLMQAVLQELFNRMAGRGVRQAQISWLGSNTPVGPLLRGLGFEVTQEHRAYMCRRGPHTLRGWLRALRGRWA